MDILLSIIGSAVLAALLAAAYTAGSAPGKPPPIRTRTTNRRSTWITRMEVRIDAEIFR